MGKSGQFPKVKVVVIDDNEDAAYMTATMLNILGYDASSTYSGPQGLILCRALLPDLVFLDLGMPDMDGYEVARQLRQNPDLKQLRIVAVTGWGDPQTVNRVLANGFDAHIQKPAPVEAMIAQLELCAVNGKE